MCATSTGERNSSDSVTEHGPPTPHALGPDRHTAVLKPSEPETLPTS
jgi:hypothetical protein